MQVHFTPDDPLSLDLPLLVFPVLGIDSPGAAALRADERLDGEFSRAVEAGDFKGGDKDELLLYLRGEGQLRRVLFLGLGDLESLDPESIRRVAARAVRRAEALSVVKLALHLPAELELPLEAAAQAAAEGAVLAAWDFRELRTSVDERGGREGGEPVSPLVGELTLSSDHDGQQALEAGIRVGVAVAQGENLARTLQARPGNIATPSHLAAVASELAGEYGFKSLILGPVEMKKERMGALLSVAAGSNEEPRLIVLEHRGGDPDDPPLALVGKGLTFDTGGISIKPAAGMEEMKYDMSGGAAVLGAMKAVGALQLPINVVAVVPSTENHISGSATKPGDVIRTRSGKTVEVINTDAEGRLILADALTWVTDKHAPAAIVDCATLTGACVVALGNQAAALLGSDDALLEEVRTAGDRSGERCWPLPLWKEYRRQLDSQVADLKNVGGRPAGTITAAWFLREFVGDTPWAHLDIAGTAYGDPRAPYQRKGAFGFPTRLLLEWIRTRAA